MHRQALELRRRALGSDHPSVAESWHSVGLSEMTLGRPERAIPSFREALDIRRRVAGDAHPEVVSSLLRLIGVTRAADADPAVIEIADVVIATHRAALPRTAPGLAAALLVRASFAEFREQAPEEAARMRTEAMQHFSVALRDAVDFVVGASLLVTAGTNGGLPLPNLSRASSLPQFRLHGYGSA